MEHIGQVDVEADKAHDREQAHQIKIFEPEMAASDGMNTMSNDTTAANPW